MKEEISIVTEIFKNCHLSKSEIQQINSKLKKVELKKGDVFIKPNTIIEQQFYTYSGCLRSYFVCPEGKQKTVQFAVKDWWISDFTALFTNKKSVLYVECIQDAILYGVLRSDLEKIFLEIPKIETFFRKKLEVAFASFQRRILDYLSLSAKEQYLIFREKYPEIEQNVRNYHIASYLGITTESLSRIRKSLN